MADPLPDAQRRKPWFWLISALLVGVFAVSTGYHERTKMRVSDGAFPYRGEPLGCAPPALISSGFDPEPFRYLFYQPAMRIFIIFGLVVAVLTAGSLAAGYALRIRGRWWPGFRALPFYGIGAVLVLILLIDVAMTAVGFYAQAQFYKNALLTPAVVVPGTPVSVVVLAPLGNDTGPMYHGLQRFTLGHSLPYHSHSPGTRVPVVSRFESGEGLDRWLAFTSEPICWGTWSKAYIDECFKRMGTHDFDRLADCVAKGFVPSTDDELILLDENDNKLKSLSIKEEKEKYQPDKG